jgi:hypothetical protein
VLFRQPVDEGGRLGRDVDPGGHRGPAQKKPIFLGL